ncbi:phage tail protein [Pseudomonas sp. RC4D1]|uniref:phage tail-collar fiber domain-containing protein n=1 Tax=Pseudomonas sp. RC4D1 TaxID=2834407 RepID=UPI001BCDBC51|nr:phage tail protein [Pseudomonas sp. RC4D1]MBS7559405.1 phage tail protein [Pseudomonas sp. RC4D1]
MGATITLAGENLIAQKQGAQQILTATRFILANVPGLDPEQPVDRAAGKPPAAQIVGTFDVTQAGYVNPNQVVYSVMLGSDIGDFDWNWIGLESADGVLLMVAHVPMQQKRRNQLPLQVGNNVTRNFLLVFDGAKALTGVTVDASTWQHDFTARLFGIDERERLANRDVFGRACFFGSALSLKRVGTSLQLAPGIAYIEGIRIEQRGMAEFELPSVPTTFWLDVSLQRHMGDVIAGWNIVQNPLSTSDYTDAAGVRRYLFLIATLLADKTLVDNRTVEPIDGPLVRHFAARVGDYEKLRARATTKEDVGLGNLPNAKSDDPNTNSSEVLATTKCVNNAKTDVMVPLVGQVSMFAREMAPAGWLKANGAAVSRVTYAALFAAIGTRFGAGDWVNTFNIPDLRGEFIRGWDDGRGLDPGRDLGGVQGGQNALHTHTARTDLAGDHTHGASSDWAGEHTHTFTKSAGSNNSPGGYVTTANGGGSLHTTNPAGGHSHAITIQGAPAHSHAVTVDASGGNETRPRNVALLACIKY